MWSRDSPFALLAIGGERHIEDRRFWVEHPQDNDTSKSDWVSREYSLSINIKLCNWLDHIPGVTRNIVFCIFIRRIGHWQFEEFSGKIMVHTNARQAHIHRYLYWFTCMQ